MQVKTLKFKRPELLKREENVSALELFVYSALAFYMLYFKEIKSLLEMIDLHKLERLSLEWGASFKYLFRLSTIFSICVVLFGTFFMFKFSNVYKIVLAKSVRILPEKVETVQFISTQTILENHESVYLNLSKILC